MRSSISEQRWSTITLKRWMPTATPSWCSCCHRHNYGEYFDNFEELKAAGQDESQYVIGDRKGMVVNGISVPKQFAIYANHQPSNRANAVLQWDADRYLDGGKHGRSPRGQHVLILKHQIDPGVEITADYGPSYSYQAHGFRRNGSTAAAHVETMPVPISQRPKQVGFDTKPSTLRQYNIDTDHNMRRYPYKHGKSPK